MKNKWFPALALLTALGILIGCVALIYNVRNSSTLIEATVDNFQDTVLASPEPVYILFTVSDAACKPCQQQAPIVEKLAAEYKGKIRFVRVDARNQPEIAQAVGLRGVPTHFFLKPAEGLGGSAEGFLDEQSLRDFLEAGLKLQKPATPAPADPNAPAVDPNAPAVDPNAPAVDPNAPAVDPAAKP
jgi:thioredoxin-like negative regulator of GroEL